MNQEIEAIDAVSRAVDRITRKGRFAEFELSNGIVLSLRPVAPLLLNAVSQEFQPPDPPKVWMEEKGRDEENPNDPDYLRELEKLSEQQNLALADLVLGIGTAVKSVPDGYFLPEEDEWIDQVQFAAGLAGKHLKIDGDDKVKRYLCWLRFYAMESGSDVALTSTLPGMLAGIREGEVMEVLENFQRVPERGPNTLSVVEAGSEDGNPTNRADRRRRTRD